VKQPGASHLHYIIALMQLLPVQEFGKVPHVSCNHSAGQVMRRTSSTLLPCCILRLCRRCGKYRMWHLTTVRGVLPVWQVPLSGLSCLFPVDVFA